MKYIKKLSLMVDNPLVCEECGSNKVQTKKWVEINTNEVMGSVSDKEARDNWCPSCETHGKVVEKEKYLLLKNED